MIDSRYHIISLVAVFLALGLGILIGGSIVGVNIIDSAAEKQGIMLGSLEKDYLSLKMEIDELRMENINKKQEIEKFNSLLEQLKIQIISDRLQGKKFALIEIGDEQSSVKKLQNLLQLSKAQILSKTTLQQELFENNKEGIFNVIAKNEIEEEICNQSILNSIGLNTNGIDAVIFIINKNFNDNNIKMINFLQEQIPVYFVKEGEKPDQEFASLFCMDNIKEEILFILELAK